jgi:phytoene dehydrogenase-like protein
VTVLEALDQPGGRARVFRRDGFTFDAGPTVITAPYLLDELFALAGRDAGRLRRAGPGGPVLPGPLPRREHFDYVGDEERLLAQIERASSPRDVDGYRRLAAHAERIFDVGYTQLADQPFGRAADMLRVLPAMMRLESYRTSTGWWRATSGTSGCARLHLRAAAGRRQPVHDDLDLPADPLAGAEVGGALRDGGTAAIVAGWSGCWRSWGWRCG